MPADEREAFLNGSETRCRRGAKMRCLQRRACNWNCPTKYFLPIAMTFLGGFRTPYPHTIEDEWIENVEKLDEMMDQCIHLRKQARDVIEMRYQQTLCLLLISGRINLSCPQGPCKRSLDRLKYLSYISNI